MEGAFTADGLEQAIRAGSVYVSNGPSLVIEVELGGSTIPMGAIHVLPSPVPAVGVTVRAHYDFGAATGRVTLFRGEAGAGSETTLAQSALVTGSGVFEAADGLPAGGSSWYRAYAQDQAVTQTAYSNPVFFRRGSGTVFGYCTAKVSSQGCTPAMSGVGTPSESAGSGFFLEAEQVINKQFGIMIYAYSPNFVPFNDGTLCLGGSLRRTPVQTSRGSASGVDCSGSFSFDFNDWIANGPDGGLVAGVTVYAQYWFRDPMAASTTGLTDAVQFTIQP